MSDGNEAVLRGHATAARTMLICAELGAALQALDAAGLLAIVLKGAALAHSVYPSIADRPMVDADLMVRREDGERAGAALQAAGFQPQAEPTRRFGLAATAFVREPVYARTPLARVEVHWSLTANQALLRPSSLDADALFAAAQPLAIAAAPALQLSPADTMLHLCVHLTAHAFTHAVGYRDIIQVLRRHQPFPWEEFVTRAQRFRLAAACYFPLEAAASALAAPVPDGVLLALRPPAWQRRLVQRLAPPERLFHGEAAQSDSRMVLLALAVADSPVAALRTVGWLFFPGPAALGERYSLEGRFSPLLACLWHPLVLLWRAAAGLLAPGGG